MWKTPLTWQHITWLNVLQQRRKSRNPNTSGPRPPSKMGFLRTLMYLLSELCPGESLGQHMSNAQLYPSKIYDTNMRHQIGTWGRESIFFSQTSLFFSFFSHLMTHSHLPIKNCWPSSGCQRKVSAECQCFATPNMSLVFCYKSQTWQNDTFEWVKILALLTSTPFVFFKVYTRKHRTKRTEF